TLTYTCGGSDVLRVAAGATSGTEILLGQAITLKYYAASAIWYPISGEKPLSALDSRYLPQFAVLPSPYTLTSQTAAQKLLNTTTNGAITLQPGVYFFECAFELSGMSSTSGSFGF